MLDITSEPVAKVKNQISKFTVASQASTSELDSYIVRRLTNTWRALPRLGTIASHI